MKMKLFKTMEVSQLCDLLQIVAMSLNLTPMGEKIWRL